jgi:splicing factor U2AF subunit
MATQNAAIISALLLQSQLQQGVLNGASISALTNLGNINSLCGIAPQLNSTANSLQFPQSFTIAPIEPKEYRELFVGNTPPNTNEEVLLEFLNAAMKQVGLVTNNLPPILTCRMNNKFAFIECRTAQDTNNCLNLNNIPFLGCLLKIGRPSKYNGPRLPSRTWQQMIGQTAQSATPIDPTTKQYRELFIGNITPEMTEVGIQEFLNAAMIKVGLANDGTDSPIIACRITGRFAFVELVTMEETANMMNLDNIPFLGVSLKISRPTKYIGPHIPYFKWDELVRRVASGDIKLQLSGAPSRVIMLTNMVLQDDLLTDESFDDLVEDTLQECQKLGKVVKIIIPRVNSQGCSTIIANDSSGIGKVFVEMCNEVDAQKVLMVLKGRTFDGRTVNAKFFPVDKFMSNDFSDVVNPVITAIGPLPVDVIIGTLSASGNPLYEAINTMAGAQLSLGGNFSYIYCCTSHIFIVAFSISCRTSNTIFCP